MGEDNNKERTLEDKPVILGKNAEAIMKLIEKKPHITIVELAEEIGITTRAVEKNVARLKKNNIIERVGFQQSGYWKKISE